MTEDHLHIDFELFMFDELGTADQQLIQSAEQALMSAYAPYSHFQVGCAIGLENGQTFAGNNQENAAYPSGLCAERVALFKCRSETQEPIHTMVVLAQNNEKKAADAFPCGACRQVMMEYAGQQDQPIRILMRKADGSFILVKDVRALLPFSFDSKTLK